MKWVKCIRGSKCKCIDCSHKKRHIPKKEGIGKKKKCDNVSWYCSIIKGLTICVRVEKGEK
jgi:hypothetical protein